MGDVMAAGTRRDRNEDTVLAVDEYMQRSVSDRLRDAYLIDHPEIDEDKSFE